MKTRIMYIENKETGEAWIGRVSFSRTYNTVYYGNKVLQRAGSWKIKGNFFDVSTGEEYWVSGPKKGEGMPIGPRRSACPLTKRWRKNTGPGSGGFLPGSERKRSEIQLT
jgi:hypothetical protein